MITIQYYIKRTITFLGLLILSAASYADESTLKLKQLSIEQGLSKSVVYSISQDKVGNIWVGTGDGLNKFNGYDIVKYRTDDENPNSLPHNLIRVLYADSRERIWVGTMAGIRLYNEKMDFFENIYPQFDGIPIWSITENSNQQLIITTSDSLYVVDDNGVANEVDLASADGNINEIKIVFQDDNDNYWFGTYESGLFISNSNFTTIRKVDGKNRWLLNVDAPGVYSIKEIDGDYWLSTDNGVYIISKDYKIQKHIKASDFGFVDKANRTRNIVKFKNNIFLLATENGLLEYNKSNNRVSLMATASENSQTIKTGTIYDLFVDNTNAVWIASLHNGALKLHNTYSLFPHYLPKKEGVQITVRSFAETSGGKVWIGTDFQGIYYFDEASQSLIKSQIELDSRLETIFSDGEDDLWFMTYSDELYHYNTKTKKATLNEYYHIIKSGVTQTSRVEFMPTQKSIWFGSDKAKVYQFSLETNQFNEYVITSSSDKYRPISTDEKHLVIVNGNGELFLFNHGTQRFSPYLNELKESFKNVEILDVVESKNFVWLTTLDKGVYLHKKNTREVTLFNERLGLNHNSIAQLLIDDNENGWISSNLGVSKINPNTKIINNYDTTYGLQSNEFIESSGLRTSRGKLYFGGVNGFNSFYSEDIKFAGKSVNIPIITGLYIANKQIKVQEQTVDDVVILTQQIHLQDRVTLNYNQSPLSIEFASPNSISPERVIYRYQLEGIDNEWIETDSIIRRATYTNLNDGNYIFNLEAYDPVNMVFKKAKSLQLTILPPFWETKLALLIYGLTLISIFYYFFYQARQKKYNNAKVEKSEERLKLALWGSGDEMWDWNLKTNKMFRSNIWDHLPNRRQLATDRNSDQDNIHPQDSKRVQKALHEHKQGLTQYYEEAYRIRTEDGDWMWVLDRGKVVERDALGEPVRMSGTVKDISQIKENEDRLKLLAKSMENISDSVAIFNTNFELLDCNISFEKTMLTSKKDAVGTPLSDYITKDKFTRNMKRVLEIKSTWQGEIRATKNDDTICLIDITFDIIKDENDQISNYVAVFSDITEKKRVQDELTRATNSDILTGLPNRSSFQKNHGILVEKETSHALIVFDLDNFKRINDSLGHELGDILLCNLTDRLSRLDTIKGNSYRLGGDEFAFIVKTTDIHKITNIAKQLLDVVSDPFNVLKQEINLSSSIGIVLYPDDGTTSIDLLKNADTAMYHAKNAGGDDYQFFNDFMNKKAVKRLQIEGLIQYGLKEELFSVFYQPKIDITNGKVSGMEALVRFQAANQGIISPDVFIPIAEETGQIIEIGEFVLRRSCFEAKAWLDNGLFNGRVAVNLSAVQFNQPNLLDVISNILKESGLPAKHLELEITEGTVMNSPTVAIETMDKIRAMGISLALDDFGTGYSSLAYLQKFPLNTLKIDRAFVNEIDSSDKGLNLVKTIISIAHTLELKVVAEGVETEAQLSILEKMKCDELQGYLYSRPLPSEDFGRYLLSHMISNNSSTYPKD